MRALPLLLLCLLIAPPVLPSSMTPEHADVRVVDRLLIDVLRGMDGADRTEVIVQFDSLRSLERSEDRIGGLGVEIVAHARVLPAILVNATREDVLAISSMPGVRWMEHNARMHLMLDLSTTVIGAVDVWNRVPVRDDGPDQDLNDLSKLYGIDGRGVTIAIVDTGVDAGHPDLDYGEKVIENWHKNGPGDSDPWIEMENSDTSYGHGTHCAGIAAGNGDASGGRRKGVAPGATIIGVGGDWTPVYWVVYEGLEWVYEHSRPGNNPHNIRIVSNSWGGDGQEYDPDDLISQISEKLTYDNNVVVVFAAGNAGENDHDGSEITTSAQSNIPAVIGVAATERDGSGIATFSSRGQKGNLDTYPDVAAPGVDIWATAPRGTWLDIFQRTDQDLYYMAISGTSMATPHVSGLAALMWQACPSLRVSNYHEEYTGNDTDWYTRETTRIHEVEYILKMTADYILQNGDNGVPDRFDDGINDRPFDYAQGYGLVNATRAVAVCLVLEEMRTADLDGDGRPDRPDTTVDEALMVYEEILRREGLRADVASITTTWRGEWAHFINQTQNPTQGTTYSTDQSHRILVPEGSDRMTVTLEWVPVNADKLTMGTIDVWADVDGDGSNDLDPQLDMRGTKVWEVDLDGRQRWVPFNVHGEAAKAFFDSPDDEFPEPRIRYTISVEIDVPPGTDVPIRPSFDSSPYVFGPGSGTVTITTDVFDLRGIGPPEEDGSEFTDDWMTFAVLALAIGGILGALLLGVQVGRRLPGKEGPKQDA